MTYPKALVKDFPHGDEEGINVNARNFVWNTTTLSWEKSIAGTSGSTIVSVDNFPAVYPVNDNGGSLTVDTPQLPVTLTGSGNLKTAIAESITLTISDGGGSLTVDGSVDVNNFPAVQSVDDNGGSLTVDNVNLDSPLSDLLKTSDFEARINTQGQKTMSGSTPVVISSDQTVIPISDNGSSITVDGTVDVSNFPAVQSVDDNGGSLTVDTPQLPGTLTGSGNLKVAIEESVNITVLDGGSSLTVDATQSGTWDITDITGTVSLPTGAATEVTLGTRLADSTFTSRINTLGQKIMAESTPVVLSSDQSSILVSASGGSFTVEGTVNAVQSGTWTVQPGNIQNTTQWLVSTRFDRVAAAPTSATVGTTSATVVSANSSRTGLILRNLSTGNKIISLGLDGSAAVLNDGITLFAGDAYYMSEYDFTTGAVEAICSAAGGELAIQEYS